MDETTALIKRAQEGETEARKILIEDNLGLVRHVVKRFVGRGAEQEDLFQVGVVGLIHAIDHFDTSLGVKLSTYAVPMIIGEIKRFLREDGPIKVSRTIRENALKLEKAGNLLREKLGREPGLEEMAKEAGLTREEAVLALDAGRIVESLEEGQETEDGTTLALGERLTADLSGGYNCASGNVNGADREKEQLIDRLVLRKVLEELPGEDRRLILLRFFRERTQTQVASELGISQVQVSRREKKILEKMRQEINS